MGMTVYEQFGLLQRANLEATQRIGPDVGGWRNGMASRVGGGS